MDEVVGADGDDVGSAVHVSHGDVDFAHGGVGVGEGHGEVDAVGGGGVVGGGEAEVPGDAGERVGAVGVLADLEDGGRVVRDDDEGTALVAVVHERKEAVRLARVPQEVGVAAEAVRERGAVRRARNDLCLARARVERHNRKWIDPLNKSW